MRKDFILLAGLTAAPGLTAGCNPAMFKKGAYAVDDWETWTGWNNEYGSHEVRGDGLHYCLVARQHDSRDEPSDGYAPGLILSRELAGPKWQGGLEGGFLKPPGQIKSFFFFLFLS